MRKGEPKSTNYSVKVSPTVDNEQIPTIYRIKVSPQVMGQLIFENGEHHFRVEMGLPDGVRYLRSGWDYDSCCVILDYGYIDDDGEPFPKYYFCEELSPVIVVEDEGGWDDGEIVENDIHPLW